MGSNLTVSWRDALLPAVLVALGLAEMVNQQPPGWAYGVALEVPACALLVFRRTRYTLVCSSLAPMILVVMPWIGPQLNDASVPVLILALSVFSLGRWLADLRGVIGLVLIALGFLAAYVFVDERSHDISDVFFVGALIAPPYVLGRVTRKLAEQSAQLERQQELVKREAVRAERDRIARELHDVIAHSVSAMVVQTAAAQDLVHSDPGKAEVVLADVAATGRRALAETGRLLHVIRDDADELGLQPAPGLAGVTELVDTFRSSGLAVDLELDEPLPTLPAGLDVSVYRIVQEALTNALKYAADRTAALRLSSTASTFSISASNRTNGDVGAGSGLGLLGMAERVSLLGGTLSHGVNGSGRFELAATLPLTNADKS